MMMMIDLWSYKLCDVQVEMWSVSSTGVGHWTSRLRQDHSRWSAGVSALLSTHYSKGTGVIHLHDLRLDSSSITDT